MSFNSQNNVQSPPYFSEDEYLNLSQLLQYRQNTCAYKWDMLTESDIIPLSVADMDYQVSQEIQSALSSIVSHGIFGYSQIPEKYYKVFINWLQQRHNCVVEREWLLCASGIMPSITAAITTLTRKGDEIIIQEPVYNRFRVCIENAECRTIVNTLQNRNGTYYIDFDDLESKAARVDCKVLLLCNPQNPTGKVWSQDELARIGVICRKHGVTVISDESHCDFIFGIKPHIPFINMNENQDCQAIICFSPGKTFNISGLKQATIIIPCKKLRNKVSQTLTRMCVDDISTFAITSQIAAYEHSGIWLNKVLRYIYDNHQLVTRFFNRYLPECLLSPLEATYLLWVDVTSTGYTGDQVAFFLEEIAHIRVNRGSAYGISGENFIRINLACHRPVLKEALKRLKRLKISDIDADLR